MQKEMTQIAVSTTDEGYVCISQDDHADHNFDSTIMLAPDQVRLPCQWIRASAKEVDQLESEK